MPLSPTASTRDPLPDPVPDSVEQLWDVVVIGTGAGGATAGYGLARQGRSVLFLERGKQLDRDDAVRRGVACPRQGDGDAALRHGWWPRRLYRRDRAGDVPSAPAVGCGTGGSTALFSMLMDRFRPEDFAPRAFAPSGSDAALPDAWPVDYAALAPFYAQAERLYRVRGTHDPLAAADSALLPPPAPSGKETALHDALTGAGLHPYRMHSACERAPGCDGCFTVLCPRECRNDAGRVCLRPALEQHGAHILSDCQVLRLEEDQRAVTRAICRWRGREIAIRARVFVLAANAFFTPALLQRSANDRFPDGLANSSGLVGRHLMLHVSDIFTLRLKRASADAAGPLNHGVSLNDFTVRHGTKLGSVHAHAVATPALPPGARLPEGATFFATILEDLPYAHNHVSARAGSDEDVVYEYRYPDELRRRSADLLQAVKAAAAPRFDFQQLSPVGQLNTTHVCGTCRFGNNPRTSVLDRHNRAHDLDNLYVVDASFFPSSGGISPSLTIAANSLRVSEAIDRRL